MLNAYNVFDRTSILIFLKMLKNNSLLSLVYGILFLLLAGVFLYSKYWVWNTSIVFEYPEWNIEFSWETVPMWWKDYYNKQRFDKEFLSASNNLYQFYLYVKRYPIYIPYIEKALKDANIPDDFKYLPLAESALRDDVVSSAWAGWIWQFMPETAKRYGLEINDFVDERYHFEKATWAAIEYIWDLHEKFWDWALVAAAYNRWENGLARDMQSQNVDNYYDLYLNEETSRYVFRIISIKYVMLSYFDKKAIIDKIIGGVHQIPNTRTIQVTQIDDLASWCKEYSYSYKDIKILNRWIISESLPEWDWDITILLD